MTNIKAVKDLDGNLALIIDPGVPGTPSTSGKSLILAKTDKRFEPLGPDFPDLMVQVLVIRYNKTQAQLKDI